MISSKKRTQKAAKTGSLKGRISLRRKILMVKLIFFLLLTTN